MTITLFKATVSAWLQSLRAIAAIVDKAEAFAVERVSSDADLLGARLAPDMLPLAFQLRSVVTHSLGAVEGVRTGSVSPDRSPLPETLDAVRGPIADTIAKLAALDPREVEGWIGRDVRFVAGARVVPFVAEDFLLSFAMPNFYFHATTSYDILRARGMALGKRDFLGELRVKP